MPLILYLVNYKKLTTKGLKVFFIYICFICLHTLLTIIIRYYGNFYTYTLLLRLFNIIELGLLSYFICLNLSNLRIKRLCIILQPLFIGYCIYDFLSSQQPQIGYFPAAVECLIMISLIIYFFFELLQKIITIPLYSIIEFWIGVSLLLYFSGNFFLFIYSQSNIQDKIFQNSYKLVYSTIIIIKNIFLTISIIFTANLGTIKKSSTFLNSELDSFLS